MQKKDVCKLCDGTGVMTLPFEYPNFIDSRWCHLCDAGEKFARIVNDIIARTYKKVRAA